MNSKRTIWIAEGLLGVIAVIALFVGQAEITKLCVLAIGTTMNMLKDQP